MANPKFLLTCCRVGNVVLGFVILVLGIFSHYRSSWVSLHVKSEVIDTRPSKLHELCEVKYFYGNCPDIVLEQFYVAVISINFIFSLLGLLTYCLWYRGVEGFHPLKWVDFGYHSVTSVLLITAAAIYIVSAVQIREFSGGVDIPLLNFRTEEKFVAGGLTIFQSALYIAMSILIGKCKRNHVIDFGGELRARGSIPMSDVPTSSSSANNSGGWKAMNETVY